MNMKPTPQHTLLALCVTHLLLLTACGGGGGGGMVRSDPPPAVQPTVQPPVQPPPSPRTLELPAPPAATATPSAPAYTAGTQDYLVNLVGGGTGASLNRVSTAGSLTKQGDGGLWVYGPSRFDAGTRVEAGELELWGDLHSDVTIASGATLDLEYGGNIIGDVHNHGVFDATSGYYDYYDADVFGDYSQSAEGMLRVLLGLQGTNVATPLLTVGGTATLDGTLQFQPSGFIPAAGYLEWVLHARGGVTGQFAQWNSPGLFIDGSVQYGSNDVYLLATRISVASTLTANGITDAMTLASAGRVDDAFASADGLAQAPAAALDAGQQRFLASAASLQRIGDVAQATRSLDSLSGQAHAMAQDVVHAQVGASVAQLDARLDRLPRGGLQAGPWSTALARQRGLGGGYDVDGQVSGFDQWLGPRWLVGGSVARARAQMQFERMGGHGRGDAPIASVYAHYRDGDWHATGVVGAGRTTLQLERPIDLGAAGTHVAQSRREIGQVFAHGEIGRRVPVAGGTLTPFAALDYTALRSDGFREHGDTGFELTARPGRSTQLSTAVGARYAQDWHAGGRWLQLNLDARYQRRLAEGGDAQQAAFAGTPDAWFDLQPWSPSGNGLAMGLGLAGGFDDRWQWSLDYARRFGAEARPGGWFVGLRRTF